MLRFGSLRARIVLFTTVPLITLLAVFLVSTLVTATRAVRSNVRKSLADAGSVVVQLVSTRKGELATMARVTARDPRFFAPFSIPLEERGPEFGPTLDNDLRDLICALRTLSVEDQNLFELRHVHGFSYAEISAMTGTTEPAGTLRARVHMINKQLRARLGHVDERLRGPSVFEPATALGDLLRRLAHMLEAMTIGPTTPGLSWPSPACRRYPRVARQHPTLRTCDRLRSSHE